MSLKYEPSSEPLHIFCEVVVVRDVPLDKMHSNEAGLVTDRSALRGLQAAPEHDHHLAQVVIVLVVGRGS